MSHRLLPTGLLLFAWACGLPSLARGAPSPPLPADGEEEYLAGVEETGRGNQAAALNHFRAVLRLLSPRDRLYTQALYGLGLAAEQLVEEGQTRACEGSAWYREVLTRPDLDPETRQAAARGLRTLEDFCAAASQGAAGRGAGTAGRSHWLAWSLTGGAVAALLGGITCNVLARQAGEEREAAYDRYLIARWPATREQAVSDVRGAQEAGQARATWSYLLLGSALALGTGAAWAWWTLSDPSPRPAVGSGAGPSAATWFASASPTGLNLGATW